jgi:hypothetical protein
MDIIQYFKTHFNAVDWALLPGNLLMLDSLIRSAAEAHGYKKTASICDKIANFLSFITDVIGGMLIKKQQTTTKQGA